MSYAATISLTLSQATDATFRAWGSAVSAQLALMGFVNTADTGQVDWATVLVPVGTAVGVPYEMWRFNDAAQATAPIFLKVEFGTLGGGYTLLVTIGSGTNGAGTLVQPSTRQSLAGSTAWGNPPALQCSFSSDPDRLAIVLGHNWLQGGGGFASVLIAIERVIELPGVVFVVTGGSGTLMSQVTTYLYRSGFGTITGGNPDMYPRFLLPRVGDGASPAGQPITGPMPIYYGRLVGFSRNLLAIFNSTINPSIPGVTNMWSVGATHTFVSGGATYKYAVAAYNSVGLGPKTADTTINNAVAPGAVLPLPLPTPEGKHYHRIIWHVTANASGYVLYTGAGGSSIIAVGNFTPTVANFSPALEYVNVGINPGGVEPVSLGYNVFAVRIHGEVRNYLACYAPYYPSPGDGFVRKSIAIRYE